MKNCFDTGVPAQYMEKIVHEVVPKIGVDFAEYKDIYCVKVVLLLNIHDQVSFISHLRSH